jgi:prophage tail gpP-like protein
MVLKITVTKEVPSGETKAPAWDKDARSTFGYSGDNLSCILEINGQLYRDWETVSVKIQILDNPQRSFRFTCSEGIPLVKNFALLRIRPGDICMVRLAGIPVVYGYVNTRQVFYDANRHYIEIQGVGKTDNLSYAGVAHKTMEFKNVNYEQYARALLKPVIPKINLIVKGGALPQMKFPRLSVAHGTSIMEALEMPLRALGNVQFGSTAMGDLVAHVAPTPGGDVLVEGKNILEGREIIFNPAMAEKVFSPGQQPGTDKKYGGAANLEVAKKVMEGLNMYRPHIMPLEIPSFSENHLKGRTNMEQGVQDNDQVTVFATVHGWLKPSGGLWEEGKTVKVISPMLIMDDELKIKSATFTQDNAHGSRTVLECVNDKALHPGVPAAPKDVPADAPPTNDAAGLPPSQPTDL